jgi:AAA+ ATPase superfamily predicted ATPase
MFIGRHYELNQIKEKLNDNSLSQLIILYGRRRVGKSRLIKEALKQEKQVLSFEGLEGEPTSVQLINF